MIVAITGSSGAGKTELINYLKTITKVKDLSWASLAKKIALDYGVEDSRDDYNRKFLAELTFTLDMYDLPLRYIESQFDINAINIICLHINKT